MFGFRKKKPADTFWDNAGEPYVLIRVRFKNKDGSNCLKSMQGELDKVRKLKEFSLMALAKDSDCSCDEIRIQKVAENAKLDETRVTDEFIYDVLFSEVTENGDKHYNMKVKEAATMMVKFLDKTCNIQQ